MSSTWTSEHDEWYNIIDSCQDKAYADLGIANGYSYDQMGQVGELTRSYVEDAVSGHLGEHTLEFWNDVANELEAGNCHRACAALRSVITGTN